MDTLQAAVRPIFHYFPILPVSRAALTEQARSMGNTSRSDEASDDEEPPRKRARTTSPSRILPLQRPPKTAHSKSLSISAAPKNTFNDRVTSTRTGTKEKRARRASPAEALEPPSTLPQDRPPTSKQNKDKRILRSQDGGNRIKSDLSRFWSDYEQILFDEDEEEGEFFGSTIA